MVATHSFISRTHVKGRAKRTAIAEAPMCAEWNFIAKAVLATCNDAVLDAFDNGFHQCWSDSEDEDQSIGFSTGQTPGKPATYKPQGLRSTRPLDLTCDVAKPGPVADAAAAVAAMVPLPAACCSHDSNLPDTCPCRIEVHQIEGNGAVREPKQSGSAKVLFPVGGDALAEIPEAFLTLRWPTEKGQDAEHARCSETETKPPRPSHGSSFDEKEVLSRPSTTSTCWACLPLCAIFMLR